jgi:chromosome partitioning protein
MTEEFGDSRPRRRLFGRRRPDEEVAERPAPVNADGNHVPAPPSPAPILTSDDAPESRPEPEADRPSVTSEPEEGPMDSSTGSTGQELPTRPFGPQSEAPAAVGALPPRPAPAAPAPVSPAMAAPAPGAEARPAPAPTTREPAPPALRPQPTPVATEPAASPNPNPAAAATVTREPEAPTSGHHEPAAAPAPAAEGEQSDLPGAAALTDPAVDALTADEAGATPLELPRIIAIANQKGGVGKTTTAVNLGAALAESGLRILVVDLDPQGNASTGLGINPRDVNASIYDVLMQDTPALDAVEPTSLKNLFVIPATLDLAGAEIELVPAFSRELKLKRALDSVRTEYDVVLIDCPPSLGLLTVNGLAAADDVIVPIQCEYYALEGLGQLLRNVALVRSSLNASLEVRGIILTMYDARTRLAEQVETEVREHFGAKVYKTVVPRTVRLAEAPSFGQPVIVFDSTSRGASAYRNLAKEVSGGATRRTG